MLLQNTFFRFPIPSVNWHNHNYLLYTAQQPLFHPHLVEWGSPFSSPTHTQNNHSMWRRELPTAGTHNSPPSKPLSPNLQQTHIQTAQPTASTLSAHTISPRGRQREPLQCWRHVGTSASARRGLSSISPCWNASSYSLCAQVLSPDHFLKGLFRLIV